MINYNDLIPTLPPRSFGFRQSSNEVWISNAAGTSYVACPGQENTVSRVYASVLWMRR